MRAVIQRVSDASVAIDGKAHASIGTGILILLGVAVSDDENEIEWLVNKIAALRIFPDAQDVMNLSLTDISGEVLVVSQFTLHAAVKKGNRPSYIRAARPEQAIPLYEKFIASMEKLFPGKVRSGVFGADMKVSLVNDGPVTILIDTENKE